MTAPIPPDLTQQLEAIAERVARRVVGSSPLRSASISGGQLTVKGGALVVESADGSVSVYFGAVIPALPDGTYQPGMILYRNDGTVALSLHDPVPDPGGPSQYQQFLAWWDREQNTIVTDDTNSGRGLARPYLGGPLAAHRFTDFRYSTTSGAFETVASWWVRKQHPRLIVSARASMDTSGSTGEMRVLVGGVQLGATSAEAFAISTRDFGPAAIAGGHMEKVLVELQGRRTSAGGTLRIESLGWEGVQS